MKIKFNDSFKFGVADADLQVIGEKYTLEEESSEETEWRQYALNTDKCYQHTTPDEGVDRYHRWKEDVTLMQKMGVRNYRTSVSMARILKRDGSVNSKAVSWYRDYYTALKNAGIEVYATLYHWELPEYVRQQGGWINRKTIDLFLKHALAVQENLGDLISEYFILNEPWCSSLLGYHLGIHAPGMSNLKDGLQAAHNLLLAQGLVFSELIGKDKKAKIGTVYNVQTAYANSAEPEDIKAAAYADGYFNAWFLEPLYLGRYPELMLELYGKSAPSAGAGDMEVMKVGAHMHALGINYYRGDILAWDSSSEIKHRSIMKEGGPTNDLGWPIYVPPHYPEAFTDILQQIYFRYCECGLKRMYITENGMALNSPWDGRSDVVSDTRRISYLSSHLKQVYDAIVCGVPVEGYFLWTLMDNFEWCHGYKPDSCFGIVHVDRKSMKRVRKQSSLWYEDVMRTRSASVGESFHD